MDGDIRIMDTAMAMDILITDTDGDILIMDGVIRVTAGAIQVMATLDMVMLLPTLTITAEEALPMLEHITMAAIPETTMPEIMPTAEITATPEAAPIIEAIPTTETAPIIETVLT